MGIPLFVVRGVTCPACRQGSAVRTPNPKLYHAAKREADLHVVEYSWSLEAGRHLIPHHYDVFQCPSCLYADLLSSVESAERSIKDHHARLAWQKLEEDQIAPFRALRALVPEEVLDLDGATATHVTALLIAGMPAEEFIDHDKLGRLSLRLGWLFRERRDQMSERVLERTERDELGDCVERLHSQMYATETTLDETISALRSKAKRTPMPREVEEEPDSAMAIAASLGDKLGEMRTLLTMLHGTLSTQDSPQAEAAAGNGGKVLGPLGEALVKLRARWAELPLTEPDCLRQAIKNLDFAYKHEYDHVSIEHTLTTLTLMMNVMIRLGDRLKALEMIAEIYNTGMAQKRALAKRIDEGKRQRRMSAHDERMLNRKINIIHTSIQQAGDARARIFDRLHDEHRDTIDRVVAKTSGADSEVQKKTLTGAGVPEELITFLRARGQLGKRR